MPSPYYNAPQLTNPHLKPPKAPSLTEKSKKYTGYQTIFSNVDYRQLKGISSICYYMFFK